ncbi:Fanconi anemia group G protein [Neosynchiropus ocellatus]
MSSHTKLLDRWAKENKDLVCKFKGLKGGSELSQEQNQSNLKALSSEFQKLLRKIQGLPPLADYTQLELSVMYNVCILSLSRALVADVQLILSQTTERVLMMKGTVNVPSNLVELWQTILASVENDPLKSGVAQLFCVQWAIWLNACQLETLLDLQDQLTNIHETFTAAEGFDNSGVSYKYPDLVMEPRRFADLLRISTIIVQGAEGAKKGQGLEALNLLQAASSLSAPRTLIAYAHYLSGYCLSQMSRPQMALHCYRKALETDLNCLSALHQSTMIYRELGNTEAEIKALRLLHSTLMLPSSRETAVSSMYILLSSTLLQSQAVTSLLSVPSALTVLHRMALKCLEHGSVSEAVKHYLDLLASLHSDHTGEQLVEEPQLPRLPVLYLEAAAALLMAHQPLDCITLSEEVITSTIELLPDKVLLEEVEETAEDADVWVKSKDKPALVLWTGAAYLLQGHCHSQLKDWKQAVTHYTRCINLVVKVRYKPKGLEPQIPSADMLDRKQTLLCNLQRLKGLALAWRGISFCQTDKLKEALRDLQFSLQAYPVCTSAGLWCGEVLWRLGRQQEAAACWTRTGFAAQPTAAENDPVYLQEPQSGPSLDIEELQRRVQELDSRL